MDAEVKQRRKEKEQKAQEQRQAEEQQRLMVQLQRQEFFTPSNFFTPSLQAPSLASLPTPNISFTPLSSLKTPLEEILDLTVHSTSSQVSTQTGLSVDNLTGPPEPSVDDFNIEAFFQEQQQQQPQQESQSTQESSTARDTDLLDMILSLNSYMTTPSQIDLASSTSDAPLSSSFSPSMPQFTPTPLTPSSSSATLSQVSLPPTDQHKLPLPNSHCSPEAIINAREVLNSMLQSGTEPRYSVIQYQQPE